jgi:uncharacterized membrane protein
MIIFYLYLIGAFITAYISWQVFGEGFREKNSDFMTLWVEINEFWYIIGITVSYPILIPLLVSWKGLDYIVKKYDIVDKIKELFKIEE